MNIIVEIKMIDPVFENHFRIMFLFLVSLIAEVEYDSLKCV
jgi:hypothetical protein